MSIATIVSVFPTKIVEKKSSHLTPSEIVIPACLGKKDEFYPDHPPVTVCILDAKTKFYIGDGQWIEAPVIAFDYARSIVYDYFTSNIMTKADPDSPVGPGLFALDGAYDREDVIRKEGWDSAKAVSWIQKEFPEALDKAETCQNKWFDVILRGADAEYNRTRNARSISDIHRLAAKRLGVEREWTKDIISAKIEKCPACRSLVDPLAMICPNCKTVIKKEEYAAFQKLQKEEALSL